MYPVKIPVCRLITLVLTALLLPASGYTQPDRLETLTVTASRDQQSLAKLAASVSIISNKSLHQLAHIHISEALSQVPGAWVNRGNGQEHLTAIRSPVLTGAGSCGAFYIAEDGIPVRATGFCNVNQLFDLNTEQAQRIEVLRGPGTVIHGSDALHGVINVITQPPAEHPETQLSLEAGSNDYGRVKISHSNRAGNHGYRINFNGASDTGYKNESGFDQQKINVRHDYNSAVNSIKTLLSLSNLNQETAGYVEGYEAYKDPQLKRQNPNPEAYRDSQSVRLQSQIKHHLDNGGIFTATPYFRDAEMAFLMHFLPGTPLEENGQTSIGLQTAYQRSVTTDLRLTNGFDLEYTDGWLKQSQQGGFSSFPEGQQYDYEVTAGLIAAFINADYSATENTTFATGIRYEILDYEYDNKMLTGDTAADGSVCINGFTGATGCRYSRPADSNDSFENLSVNVNLLHQFTDQLNGAVRFAHGFRAPQATELYRLQNGQLQANLDSEEINSLELALRGYNQQFSYSLTSFYMKKTNVIFQSSERLNLGDGQTQHYGLEYDLSWQFSPQWDINVTGTFARHQYTADVSTPGPSSASLVTTKDNDIDTAPRRMHSLRVGWQPSQNHRIEMEWQSMGKYYTDIDNQHSYEGHNLIHLRFRSQLSKLISVGLRINNVADIDYAERADYSSFNGDRYFIGEPRSYFGDITLKF